MTLSRKRLWLAMALIVWSFPLTAVAESLFPLRGDQGPLKQVRPQAALWLSDDRLLVCESNLNNLQIFDTEGRRFRLFEAADNSAPAHFVGLAKLADNDFMVLGSHYHEKNHPRYRDQRSRLHRFYLNPATEDLKLDDFKVNIAPLEPLRKTRMWGSTPLRALEFSGFGVDAQRDVAWFGLTQPKSEKGNLSLLRCSLKGLLEGDANLQFTEVDTGFALPMEENCQRPTYLTDLAVLDDGSVLLLLSADDVEGKRFCTNSLWRWTPGGQVVEIKKNLAPNNRATGMAVRSLGQDKYRIAFVCDNDTEKTDLNSNLVILSDVFTLR